MLRSGHLYYCSALQASVLLVSLKLVGCSTIVSQNEQGSQTKFTKVIVFSDVNITVIVFGKMFYSDIAT